MKQQQLVYVAGPLFTPGDRQYLESIESICRDAGFRTYLPHRDAGVAPADGSVTLPFFDADIENLCSCAIVVAVLNGTDVDSGTAFELGYAYASSKRLIGIYEDTRISDARADLNLMISSSTEITSSRLELQYALLRSHDLLAASRSPSDRAVAAVLNRLEAIGPDLTATTPDTFGYGNVVLAVVDAVLSINRPYRRFVQPRVDRFRRVFPDIDRIPQLLHAMDELGEERFGAEVLDYRDMSRVKLLRRVAERMLTIVANTSDGNSEHASAAAWLRAAGIHGNIAFNVKGIGVATYQYLRMLLGISTVKPDVHIVRFVRDATGKRVSSLDAVRLIELAARASGTPATTLDHGIWRHYARP